jgi:hypothetical protein
MTSSSAILPVTNNVIGDLGPCGGSSVLAECFRSFFVQAFRISVANDYEHILTFVLDPKIRMVATNKTGPSASVYRKRKWASDHAIPVVGSCRFDSDRERSITRR